MHRLEHTKLRSLVDSIQTYFDPDDKATLIDDDKEMVSQFNEFEKQFKECNEDDSGEILNQNGLFGLN